MAHTAARAAFRPNSVEYTAGFSWGIGPINIKQGAATPIRFSCFHLDHGRGGEDGPDAVCASSRRALASFVLRLACGQASPRRFSPLTYSGSAGILLVER